MYTFPPEGRPKTRSSGSFMAYGVPELGFFRREAAFSAPSEARFARCELSFVLKTHFFSPYCGNVPDASTERTEPTRLGRAPRLPTEMSEYPNVLENIYYKNPVRLYPRVKEVLQRTRYVP